nr:transporter substrate-binding domain-containing protein [Aeromonas hydrophila]
MYASEPVPPAPLTVSALKYYEKPSLPLNQMQKQWLTKKVKLVLAVSQLDSPPLDVIRRKTLDGFIYEGVNADFSNVIASSLNAVIEVKSYRSRQDAMQAVINGDADFISSVRESEDSNEIALTQPYLKDAFSLYKRIGLQDRDIKKVALVELSIPRHLIRKYLPNVDIEYFPSPYSAVAAAVYGNVDAVLIDSISGNFIKNKFYNGLLDTGKEIVEEDQGLSFATVQENNILQGILDVALLNLPHIYRVTILKRWNGGKMSVLDGVGITDEDKSALRKKSPITIAINTNIPPLSYIDKNGNYAGVMADILQHVANKLAVDFDILQVSSYVDAIRAVESGNADLIFMSPSPSRWRQFVFTRSFIFEPVVYLVRSHNVGRVYLDNMTHGGSLAVLDRDILSSVLINDKFTKNTIKFSQLEDALSCVLNGECQAIVLPLSVARYFSDVKYSGRLAIAGEAFQSTPFGVGFAGTTENRNLIETLDKVISLIPPDGLNSLEGFREVSVKRSAITWWDLYQDFGVAISISIIIISGVLLWSVSLRKQIKLRRAVEADLNTKLNFIQELVDSTPHPVYSRDDAGRLTLCNHSYSAFLGEDKKTLLGTLFSETESRWPYLKPLLQVYEDSICDGLPRHDDYTLWLENRKVHLYHWLQPIRDSTGQVNGVVGGWIDVSERIRLLDELAAASQEAQKSNRAKSTFLATMSHEIRTPMNAIIGLLELTLRRDRLHEEDKTSLSIAHGSARDLLSLIGDILDISKIESGRLELRPEPHEITALTASVVTVFTALARQKNLQLELAAGEPRWVQIDGICYKQILSNLISNAIKYTEQGSVRVELQSKTSDGWCTLQLVIRDTGIGIAPVEQARLFQPFGQARQPEHIQRSGTGLGLMISRSLCESMGGSLLLESEPGHGTCISIEMKVPLASAVESVTPVALGTMTGHHRRLRVMIVDDHPTNRLLVSQQLAYLGHDATAAESGREALALFANTPFDVVITDFNMPGMSGFELTRQYRALELSRGTHRCLILGLTADARQEQVSEGLAAGMDDCLFKPVGLEELERCLCRHMLREEQLRIASCMHEIKQCLGPLTGNQSALMQPLLSEFVRASDDDLLGLQQAAEGGELARFLDYVHRLKGGARIMGAMTLVAVCGEIESGGIAPQGLPMALLQLQHAYGIVRQAMVQMQAEPE